nr:pseudouridine-5'-phosphatase-like isoform X5 [Cherax quadricarinatus]
MCTFKPVTHVIFDMDGLLLDTESLYTAATECVIHPFGKTYTWEVKVAQMGQKAENCAKIIINTLQVPLSVEDYLRQVTKIHQKIMPTAQLMPDTERLYTDATQAIASQYNKVYTWEIKVQCMGMKGAMAAQCIIDSLHLPLTVDQYLEKIISQYDTLFPNAQILPGAEKLVRHLHKHSIPIAIASGGAQDSFELKTTNHKEFVTMFSHVVLASTDPEVQNGKPAPDVFLLCANRFSDTPKPEQCLVFEDAPNGVAAGVAAGMQVVMVPDPRLDDKMTKGASQVLKSLEDFRPELFGLPKYDD